ncbi:hypothetical protein GCM10009547_43260 [Sporichthya brevicatena]|uniref:Uncharacterized protein n=1 Tax=Sporichthya brevicatena TaxID=171442 RepID=A0ABP3SDS2_9ACTN
MTSSVTPGRPVVASPWSDRANAVVAICWVLGLGGIAVSWMQVSNEARFADQQPWVVFGLGCVVGAALAGGLWLGLGLKAVRVLERTTADRLVRVLEEVGDRRAAASGVRRVVGAEPHVAVVGLNRAHRPDCQLVVGKDAVALDPAQVREAATCGVCA